MKQVTMYTAAFLVALLSGLFSLLARAGEEDVFEPLLSVTLFGFDSIVFWFIAFQFLQIGLSVLGFSGIKWLENIGSVFIIGALIYMFFSVINKYGNEISTNLLQAEGSWGAPFWGATMLFLGVYSTMMLNVSDYSRELKETVSPLRQVVIYANSILPATLFMGLIGLMVSSATGEVDPIKVFSSAVDNKVLLIITLLFIVFAQVTTNVLNNVIPPAYALMDVFKLNFKTSAVLVGLLAFATFPWELVKDESAAGLNLFIQTYSAFLGPIFAVLVVDYYLLRKRQLNLDLLYDENGPYRGVNWAAIIATALGVVVALIFGFLFPRVAREFGVLRCLKLCVCIFPFCYIAMPFTALLPTQQLQVSACFVVMLVKGLCSIFAFPCSTILLTN